MGTSPISTTSPPSDNTSGDCRVRYPATIRRRERTTDVNDSFAGLTVEGARRALAQRLAAHGVDAAELDARLLVGDALDLDLTALMTAAHRPLTREEAERISAHTARRLAGEPVARIVGEKEFWGL